jgi:hypothetical protein
MSGIPSQAEYERNERIEAIRHEREVDAAPLADRKDAQRAFFEAMRDDPGTVGERISWLIDGNYGYGPMRIAKEIVASPRMNRRAGLTLLVGIFEWQCPRRMGADAWKKLTKPQKALLDRAVDVVIAAAEADRE